MFQPSYIYIYIYIKLLILLLPFFCAFLKCVPLYLTICTAATMIILNYLPSDNRFFLSVLFLTPLYLVGVGRDYCRT